VSGTNVVLVIGAVPLLRRHRSSHERLAFRWYTVEIQGSAGALAGAIGARNVYVPPADATAAAQPVCGCRSIARTQYRDDPRDRIPPYSARIDLPQGTLIDLATYERVMNFLERARRSVVVLRHATIRAAHVDPGAVGHAVPMTGRLAHTFREFQQHRHRGAVTVRPRR